MSNFVIINEEKTLADRINELIPHTEEIKILVGFFYFSGLDILYHALKENENIKLKVLVGLDVDEGNYSLYEYAATEGIFSKEDRINLFLQSLKKSLNHSNFDNKDFYEKAKFYIELLETERLIIRKTKKPHHGKFYLFKLNEHYATLRKNLFITGSSNFTKSGLSFQQEFNIELLDFDTKNIEKYFDKLWESSIELTEDNVTKDKIIKIIKEETPLKEITPFKAYVYSLKTYLDTYRTDKKLILVEKQLEEKGYKVFSYQLDAIKQGLSIIEENNGVIVADVVGLGKSIIASSIAFALQKKGIIICPPGLMENWKEYMEDFSLNKLDWKVYSSGKLDEVLKEINKEKNKDIEVVIVDEAHRFRNEKTKSYDLLSKITRGKITILLTATPFNNRPSDIFSLLKLFQIPKKSTIVLEENSVYKFKYYERKFSQLLYIKKYLKSKDNKKRKRVKVLYKNIFREDMGNLTQKEILSKVEKEIKYLAEEIKRFIQPVMIRRNRLDLKNNPIYRKEIKDLPEVEDPINILFELNYNQLEFYDKVISKYFNKEEGEFKGVIYIPYVYYKGIDIKKEEEIEEQNLIDDEDNKENFEFYSQTNLRDFMRRLLIKRFESSFGAFEQSIRNFLSTYEMIYNFIKENNCYLMDRRFIEDFEEYEDPNEELRKKEKEYMEFLQKKNSYNQQQKYMIYYIDKMKLGEQFLKDIESDIELFKKILKELEELKLVNKNEDDNIFDPKAKKLIEIIQQSLSETPKRKVIVFSEYKDTVEYLKPILEKYFKVLTVNRNLDKNLIKKINENFDYKADEQKDDYDVLLTTDRVSEGFNLARAGMVVNYDIPWNPVIVIQRLGRINRIGQRVFNSLKIVNFFPTEQGESHTRQKEIAEQKLFLIHNSIGEDAKIFSPDEEPNPSELYKRLGLNPDEMEEESFFTKVIKEYQKIKERYPEIVKEVESLPYRIKVAKEGDNNEMILLIRKGKNLFIRYKDYNKNIAKSTYFEEIFEKIKSSPEDKSLEKSDNFWEVYEELKNMNDLNREIGYDYQKGGKDPEVKARNFLSFLLNKKIIKDEKIKEFIGELLKDINNYGTIPVYTLKEIASLDDISKNNKSPEEIINYFKSEKKNKEIIDYFYNLMGELGGENFLNKIEYKTRVKNKEILIAIENRKI